MAIVFRISCFYNSQQFFLQELAVLLQNHQMFIPKFISSVIKLSSVVTPKQTFGL